MKFSSAALFITTALVSSETRAAQGCITTGFTVEFDGECNYDNLLEAFEEFYSNPLNRGPNCPNDAATAFEELVGGDDPEATVEALCVEDIEAFDHQKLFQNIPFENGDQEFIKQFYLGGTFWNEDTETNEPDGGEDRKVLREQTRVVNDFYRSGTGARYMKVEWPSYLPNFETCSMNAAYCCWPRDRGPNDGNGNCARDTDERCIDTDPADNTDLCAVDLTDGAQSTGFDGANGTIIFPGDDNNFNHNAEGTIHCHGLGWADNLNDQSHVLRGNNLFYVSMYDHMYVRGYVSNVPGAPMCACAEQMPIVSRADCTQMAVEQSYKATFTGTAGDWDFEPTRFDITFQSCDGVDRYGDDDSNDLWSYMNLLHQRGQLQTSKLRDLSERLVGDDPNQCALTQKKIMAEKGYKLGHNLEDSEWTLLAGRDVFEYELPFGKVALRVLLSESGDEDIYKRVCAGCYDSHVTAYYRRSENNPIPDGFDLLSWFKTGRNKVDGNVHGVDFEIYSTLEDAENRENPWVCGKDGYKYNANFPGDCGPERALGGQGTHFGHVNRKSDVAFYVNTPMPFTDVTDTAKIINFDGYSRKGTYIGSAGTVYSHGDKTFLQSKTGDIWNGNDSFMYIAEEYTGDVEATVYIEDQAAASSWTKSGIMIRDHLGANSSHFFHFSSGSYGPIVHMRYKEGHNTHKAGYTGKHDFQPYWYKVIKRGSEMTAYLSTDGVNFDQFADPVKITIGDSFYVGFAATTNEWHGRPSEVSFSGFTVDEYNWPSAAPSASPAPSVVLDESESFDIGWMRDGFAGNSSYAANNDLTTIVASGSDIWNRADGFHYIPEEVTDDFVAQVYVQSITGTHVWAKAGIMVRETLEANSTHASALHTNSMGPGAFYRAVEAQDSGAKGLTRKDVDGMWLRVEREGGQYTLSKSTDASYWSVMGELTIDALNGTVWVGMAATSHNTWQYSTSVLRDYTLTPVGPSPPTA